MKVKNKQTIYLDVEEFRLLSDANYLLRDLQKTEHQNIELKDKIDEAKTALWEVLADNNLLLEEDI